MNKKAKELDAEKFKNVFWQMCLEGGKNSQFKINGKWYHGGGEEVKPIEKVQIPVEFDKDYIEGLLTDVGLYVGYWAEAPVGDPKFPMTISEFGDDGLGKKHTVTSEDVVRGVTIVANEHPRLWGYICDQNPDADVADVVLQCAIFGETKYG